MLTFTLYSHKRDTFGETRECSWVNWAKRLSQREVRAEKDGPAIILGPVKGPRRAKNTGAAHAMGLDMDDIALNTLEAALEPLEHTAYMLWTTHSHAIKGNRFRLIVPFATPVSPSEFLGVWTGFQRLLGGILDPQCKDICRLHFLPSCPSHLEDEHFVFENEGLLFDSRVLPSEGPVRELPKAPPNLADIQFDLEGLRQWLATNRTLRPQTRKAGRALVANEPYAAPGDRHDTTVHLTWAIAKRSPNLTPTHLEALFAPSILLMGRESPDDAPTLEEVQTAYDGARAKFEEAPDPASYGPVYTPQELEDIAEAQGFVLEDLPHRWIIQRDDTMWFLDHTGDYKGPFRSTNDQRVAAVHILEKSPVIVATTNEDGDRKYRPLTDLAIEHGAVITKVIPSLLHQRNTYDPGRGVLYEAVCPIRDDLEPNFDPQIDQWLKHLAQSQYDKLADWLACLPDLEKLLCALYFQGEPGSGKSLLAHGAARLWTEGPPAPIDRVLSDFNDEWARCPLALADEDIPRSFKRDTVTTQLREIIGSLSRSLNRKYRTPSELVGAVRLVLAANNDSLLNSNAVATAADLEAIAQRFLYIPVPRSATKYLESLPRETKQRWGERGIAEHILHLAIHREVTSPGKRFWVEGDVSTMHRLITIGNKWSGLVCEWLVRYLLQPKPIAKDPQRKHLITREDGELLVNTQLLVDRWDTYLPKTRQEPETSKIGKALRSIAASDKRLYKRTPQGRVRYWVIDTEHLAAWADSNDVGTADGVRKAIEA